MKKEMTSVGARISELLRYRGMTQKQLAEKAKITEAAVCRYVKGERVPRAITVAAIAKALEVSPSELLGEPSSDPENIDNAVRLIARNARVMTEEQREMIIRALACR